MSSLYKDRILKHYREPRHEGVVDDADAEVHVDNPQCGDAFDFSAVIEDGTVEEIKFTGDGCALSVAAASLLSEEVQDAAVETVKNIPDEDVFALLGLTKDEVSPMRMQCVLLARDAVKQLVDGDDT